MSFIESNISWESSNRLSEESGKYLSRVFYHSNNLHMIVTDNDFLETHADLIRRYLKSGSHLTLYTADSYEDPSLQGNIVREKLRDCDVMDLWYNNIHTLVIDKGDRPQFYWEKYKSRQKPTPMFDTIGGWFEAIADVGHEMMGLLGMNKTAEKKQGSETKLSSHVIVSFANENLATKLKERVNVSLQRNVF